LIQTIIYPGLPEVRAFSSRWIYLHFFIIFDSVQRCGSNNNHKASFEKKISIEDQEALLELNQSIKGTKNRRETPKPMSKRVTNKHTWQLASKDQSNKPITIAEPKHRSSAAGVTSGVSLRKFPKSTVQKVLHLIPLHMN
jgi:hypothetical protein